MDSLRTSHEIHSIQAKAKHPDKGMGTTEFFLWNSPVPIPLPNGVSEANPGVRQPATARKSWAMGWQAAGI